MSKIVDLESLAKLIERVRQSGQRVALANGAFDMLHVGHVRYLCSAKQMAEILVVAINSDASVHRLKGPGRPVFPERERAEIVAALEAVDYVLLFDADDVRGIIRLLRPDLHVKGTDYTAESVPERDEVIACGGRVVIAGDPKDHSSSKIIKSLSGDE